MPATCTTLRGLTQALGHMNQTRSLRHDIVCTLLATAAGSVSVGIYGLVLGRLQPQRACHRATVAVLRFHGYLHSHHFARGDTNRSLHHQKAQRFEILNVSVGLSFRCHSTHRSCCLHQPGQESQSVGRTDRDRHICRCIPPGALPPPSRGLTTRSSRARFAASTLR